ncbi:MAG: DUF4405 domain-containing protein [Solidesulfovibrio sp.]
MLKKIVSMVLFFSLFLMLLTALVVYVEPASRVASWANWRFLGLSREHWDGAHLGMGLLFCVAGLAHLALNWDALLDHLRDRDGVVVVFTKPFFLGLIVSLAVFIASLAGVPPIRQLVMLSGYVKDRAVDTYGEPPYSMAERSTLEDFARRMGIDAEKALALLRLRNIKADSASQTLAEIASKNGVAPGGVFEALKMVMEASGGSIALPKDPPPGLGRRKLSDICEEYGLDLKAVLSRLEASGIKAQPAWTLAEVAKTNNVLPITVYEALRTEKNTSPVPMEVSSSPKTVEISPVQPVQPMPAPVAQPQPAAPLPIPSQPTMPTATVQPQPLQPAQPVGQPTTPTYPGTAGSPAASGQTPAPGYAPYAQPVQPGYAAPTVAAPITPPPGLGKMMLQSFCREYGIPLSVAVQRLSKQNITAFGDMTFEELSLENNRTPADIMHFVTTQ